MHRRVVAVSGGVALAALLLSSCEGGPEPRGVVWAAEAGGWTGIATSDVAPGDPVSLGSMNLCVEGEDAGEVVAVRSVDGSAVEITAFTVMPRTAPEMFGGDRVALADIGIPTDGRTVDVPCGGRGNELVVEARSSGPERASTERLIVEYRVGDHRGYVTVPVGVMLCAPGVQPCSWEPE